MIPIYHVRSRLTYFYWNETSQNWVCICAEEKNMNSSSSSRRNTLNEYFYCYHNKTKFLFKNSNPADFLPSNETYRDILDAIFLHSQELKVFGELVAWQAFVDLHRPSSTRSNCYISATNKLISIKLYIWHTPSEKTMTWYDFFKSIARPGFDGNRVPKACALSCAFIVWLDLRDAHMKCRKFLNLESVWNWARSDYFKRVKTLLFYIWHHSL